MEVVDSSSTTPTIFFKDNSLVTNKLRGFFFAAILSSKLHQNAPKCPVFQQQLRNFTERILTSTLCKILLPHDSICTIKRKLRNFTEFYRILPITFISSPITYGSYGWFQPYFLFIRVQKSSNFIFLPPASTSCSNTIAQSETISNI